MTLYAPENLAPETLTEVPCHQCGYDVRAHAADGVCPECAASVAESRQVAAIPVRPKWAESDPRWRRRMLAGVWLLVMVPLVDVIVVLGWADGVLMPNLYGSLLAGKTLRDTMIFWNFLYQPVVMCMGLVLLFSPERGRRRGRLDWVRRWGVFGCYVVLFLAAVDVLFITALVTAGIGALLMSIALNYQPAVTPWFVEISYAYLRFGPSPGNTAFVALSVSTAVTVLLACVPLYDALRATVDKRYWWVARIATWSLALSAAVFLTRLAGYMLGIPGAVGLRELTTVYYTEAFKVAKDLAAVLNGAGFVPLLTLNSLTELAEWGTALGIAVWLSAVQFFAWRASKRLASG